MILLWTFLIGLPRVVLYFMTFNDSIFRRRIYATVMTGTTALQFLIFVIDQFGIFMHDNEFCDRVYAVWYMKDDWGITCEWSIVCYEICMLSALIFYIYASIKAVGFFHLGFEEATLTKKEAERLKCRLVEDQAYGQKFAGD